jgi:hypothetical protein
MTRRSRLLGIQLAVQLSEVQEARCFEQGVLLRLLDQADEPVLPGSEWHPPSSPSDQTQQGSHTAFNASSIPFCPAMGQG